MRKIAIVLLIMFGVLLTSLVFIGCKSTTSFTNKETKDTSSSSQVTNKETKIKDSSRVQPKVEIKYVIVNPCDSNGKLKPINQSINAGGGKLKTTSNKDTLFIDCDCDEQIQRFRTEIRNKDSLVSNLKTRLIIDSKKETINVEVTPVWVWKVITGLLLLIIILSAILYIKLR
jgi:hypothetical protein